VLWAAGIVIALVAIALLLINLGMWEDLSQLSNERKERVATFMGIGVTLTVIIVLLTIGGASRAWTGFANRTVWDWLQLLIVPVALASIGFWFTVQQDARQQQIEDQRAKQAQQIEDRRAKAERELAEQRAQDEALQAYLSQMGSLLLEEDLRDSDEYEVRNLARARTLTVLERLDPSRKEKVMLFLIETNLVQRTGDLKAGGGPILGLDGADLSKVTLSSLPLSGAHLEGVNLEGADLAYVRLEDADLSAAQLSNADLHSANLEGADLAYADLEGADLHEANLKNVRLTSAKLDDANLMSTNLAGVDFSDDLNLVNAVLPYANLSDTDLSEADLEGANLASADLEGANLPWANLSDTDLRGADLSGATGWTEGQLTAAKSLEGATMPDGQILKSDFNPGPTLEEWLKSKGRGEDSGE
jgi:uncharacterized protein YjbI with pentapeptide repeats